MPRLNSLASLMRPLAMPRVPAFPQLLQPVRFSTAARRPSPSPSPSPQPPTTPQAASRAADLAAAEAIAESDSAQPPQPKPQLPSKRPNTSLPKTPSSPSRTPSPASIQLPPPTYVVSRSANKNLPIYTDYKRGGNLHLTTVRKITGDLSALRDELRVYLNKKNEQVTINSLTGHVVVKGHHTAQIKQFLEARGM